MMKKILYFFMTAALLCSCEKEEVNIVDTAKLVSSLKHIDIADAQSLFIATSTLTRGGIDDEEKPVLYKITFNGETKEVEFIDEEGNKPSVWTNYTLNLSDKFLLVNVGFDCDHRDYSHRLQYAYIVRKSDGAMFAPRIQNDNHNYLMSGPMSFFEYKENLDVLTQVSEKAWQLQVDDEDNVYYSNLGICKIYDDATGNVFVEKLVSYEIFPNDPWEGFNVNGNGDVWMLKMFDDISLCRLNTGDFVRDENYDGGYQSGEIFTLPGYPKNYYRLDADSFWMPWTLYRYTPQPNILKEEVINSGNFQSSELTSPAYQFCVVMLDDCSIIFAGGGIFVVRSETDVRFCDVAFPENKENRPYLHSDKYVYAADNGGNIMRFDPSDGTVSTVYANRRYQIETLRIFSDDIMQFSGYDLQTGESIIVQIENGQEHVLDRIDGRKIIQMERLN